MKTSIAIPKGLEGFTLRQYKRYLSVENPTDEDLLKCFLDLDSDFIYSIEETSFKMLVDKIEGLLNSKADLVHRFKFNGIEYGFEPNLDECTYGVNKDATTYLSDINTFHKAIEVLYRPVTKKYKGKYLIEPYKGTTILSESFNDVTLDVVLGMSIFFYNLTNDLVNCIPNYLAEQVQTQLQPVQDLAENGVLIKKYIHLQKETLETLTRLQALTCTNA